MDIGVVIKKYRKEAGMTQEEMANRLGVTTPAVNKWENSNSKPDIELLAPIARLLDISLDTLLSFHEKLSDTEIEEIIRKMDRMFSEEGYEKTMVSMQGIGYRQVFEYLEGNLSLEDTIDLIKKDTRHFAKRQLTWFGREKEVVMVDKSKFGSEDEILTYMLTILKEKGIYDESVKELL